MICLLDRRDPKYNCTARRTTRFSRVAAELTMLCNVEGCLEIGLSWQPSLTLCDAQGAPQTGQCREGDGGRGQERLNRQCPGQTEGWWYPVLFGCWGRMRIPEPEPEQQAGQDRTWVNCEEGEGEVGGR